MEDRGKKSGKDRGQVRVNRKEKSNEIRVG